MQDPEGGLDIDALILGQPTDFGSQSDRETEFVHLINEIVFFTCSRPSCGK